MPVSGVPQYFQGTADSVRAARSYARSRAAGRGRERERQKSGQIIVGNNDKRINWRDLWPEGQKIFAMCIEDGDVVTFAKIGDRASSLGDYLRHDGKTALGHERCNFLIC